MSWNDDLKRTLKELEVPDHNPQFWSELEAHLNSDTPDRAGRRSLRFRWKTPVVAIAAVTAVVVGLTVALPASLTPSVLAYSFPEGTSTYTVEYDEAQSMRIDGDGAVEAGSPVSTHAEGTLTYTVGEGPEAGSMEITLQTEVPNVNVECGHADCSSDESLFDTIPALRFVVQTDGALIEYLPPAVDDAIPALVLPDPLPGSSISAGMPFGFGPPFPDSPLQVGDTWTTAGDRSRSAGSATFTAQHEVIREEIVAGHNTLVIESVYLTAAAEVVNRTEDPAVRTMTPAVITMTSGPELVETTVWFDPVTGIIVRAELERTTTAVTAFENGQTATSSGTTRMLVELIPQD